METVYFVSWYIHNKENNEWNGTIVDKYETLDAAKKEYHKQLGMYIDDEQFDSVAVMITNSMGGVNAVDYWTSVVPEPPIPPENTEE